VNKGDKELIRTVLGADAATREKIEAMIDRLIDGRLLVSDRENATGTP
jgi:hypothetical protein